ncbi:uncharacterized protein si:dkey-87o1.2 [Pleuronectes platessa]|nr:uncharacterized protein si:dkey-87o1.2 [Pleuronectes platessa]
MKLVGTVVVLSVAVMTVLIYQALRQEIRLRGLKTRTAESHETVKAKEEMIIEVKKKTVELKTEMDAANAKIDELRNKKAEVEKSIQEFEKSLTSCNTEKEAADTKKKEVWETMNKLKADHAEAKKKAEEDIQTLKQQILDKDKAICAFADMTKEEAKKLCGTAAAAA